MRPGRIVLWTTATVIGVTWISRRVGAVGQVWPVK